MKRLFLIAATLLLTIGTKAQEMPDHILKLMYTGNIIENFYVDDADYAKVAEEGIKAMLKKLDPHSTYTDPKETKALIEQMEGSFSGIGVQFNIVSDTLYVIQTTKNGPSERAGILAGDKIITVNDTTIAGVKMDRGDIMTRLRGKKGTTVELDIVRRGIDRTLHFTLVRDDISTETVDAAYMIDDQNGYIRINSFGAKTHYEFVTKLDSLKREGMKNLIIDLGGNGGGYLTSAVEIASELIDESNLIVYTEGQKSPRYEYTSFGSRGKFRKGNLVIIVDETSASASEILAGAVQDWDRGIIVGRRTFGKGLVQRPFQLPDGSMIRLTIARYYTPTGRCIQKPYDNDSLKYEDDLLNRYNSGEMTSADKIHFPDSLKTYTKRLKRPVYGGGGIMPDYFVPVDTARYTKYHRELARKGSIIQASLHYIDENREKLVREYPNIDDFENRFEVDDTLIELLKQQAIKDSVKVESDEEFQRSLPEIKLQLKQLVARDLWDMEQFIKLYNRNDASFNKAYELVQQRKQDKLLLKE